ncbi:heavy metal translocating P-type ATPase [Roseateles amylovorans]|uniref:P-type Zn(2+) transporter n=1 Tax=Roseateles amylovorans TaxID=2978473 RepID=A0ABY6AYQ8_9BURK|nr:cation-translocating P-type ATPase [Roseateles amylovorans]UXH78311.1 cation-translocating P-type ATPase [Roseateles amylovorans]
MPPASLDGVDLTGTTRHRYYIAGMDCPTEEGLLRRHLQQREGVVALQFDLINRMLDVHHRLTDDAPLRAAIEAAGLRAETVSASAPPPEPPPAVPTALRWRMALAGVAAIAAEALAFAGLSESGPVVIALAVAAMLLGGLPTLRKGWIALRSLTLNIHLLMSLAVIGAIVLGQWPEAAMVVWLFGLSEMMESLSLARARDAIRALTQLAPEVAWVKAPDGRYSARPAAEVPLEATVRVPPGERVPLDGQVLAGRSSLNEAALTGEAMPVDKAVGDPLLAGSINGDGLLEMQVTAAKGHTLLDRMAAAVQQAQSQRAPTQAFIDRFARIYTPAVVLAAVLLAVLPPLFGLGSWNDWLYKGLVLLVIACPCALVISTPVTIVSGLASAARRGILIKGGLYLESARKIRTLALDKTGTLTEGRPQLVTVQPLYPSIGADQALHLAARLDAGITHPLAAAIVAAHAQRLGTVLEPVQQLKNLPGLGMTALVDGQDHAIGNERLAESRGAVDDEARAAARSLQAQGHTLVWLMRGPQTVALLALSDTPRPEAAEVLARLRARGLALTMLSGDQRPSAVAMAERLGLAASDVRAPLLPQDKLDAVAALSAQGPVAMVGDGVNDAPALARADIAIAMGAAGSATALETADIALMQDDLRKLPELLDLSERVSRILSQNIALALGLKAVVAVMTLMGIGSLWLAVLADAGASLLVVLNGLRLLRKPPSER